MNYNKYQEVNQVYITGWLIQQRGNSKLKEHTHAHRGRVKVYRVTRIKWVDTNSVSSKFLTTSKLMIFDQLRCWQVKQFTVLLQQHCVVYAHPYNRHKGVDTEKFSAKPTTKRGN